MPGYKACLRTLGLYVRLLGGPANQGRIILSKTKCNRDESKPENVPEKMRHYINIQNMDLFQECNRKKGLFVCWVE